MTIIRINSIYLTSLLVMISLFSSSCVFQEQVGETAVCMKGEEFNAVERKCQAVYFAPAFPVARLNQVTFPEDAGMQTIELTYTDRNSDPLLACEIIDYDEEIDGDLAFPPTCSCTDGKCFASILSDKNFHGLSEFHYRVRDKDGRSDIKMVGVEVTPVADPPIADMNSMDEEFLYTVINEDQSNRADHFTQGFNSQAANASVDEGRRKTIYLWGSDPDGDVVNDCRIVSHSPYLQVLSDCYCEADIFLNGSICNVEILSIGNYSGPGEYITYKVKANGDWSVEETHFIEVIEVDDPPLICHYSQYEEKQECTMGTEDECRSTDVPLDTVIVNHTNSRPVMYLNERKGECYRSVKKEDGTFRWTGSLFDRGNFLSGIVEEGTSERIEYPYGAEWISVKEDSEVNFFNVQAAFDVDTPLNQLKYFVEDNTTRGSLKSCLSNNIKGDKTPNGSQDLLCQYDLFNASSPWAKNLNDDYLTDTVTINNVSHSGSNDKVYPTLRFRAKKSGDLSKTPQGRICVGFTEGAVSGNASVSVNSFYHDGIEKDYCHNGFSESEAKNECGTDHVSVINFHHLYPVKDRTTMDENFQIVGVRKRDEITLKAKDDVGADIDIRFTFHRCKQGQVEDHDGDGNDDAGDTGVPDNYCECNDRQLDPTADDYCHANADGTYHVHFDDTQTDEEQIVTSSENMLFALQRLSDQFEARVDSLLPTKIWIKHLGVEAATAANGPILSDNRDGDDFEGVNDPDDWIVSQESFTPYWQYDCGNNQGGYGRYIEVKIEDGVTTSQTIKEAIESDSIASSLVDVHMYASRKETVHPAGLYNEETGEGIYAWPRVLGGGRDYADSMTYYAVDQVTGSRSNLGRVYFSIANVNDHPYLPGTPAVLSEVTPTEDQLYEFELTPAQDPDFAEDLSYMITDDTTDGGVLSGCADLPGSSGPSDLTCIFTPNEHFEGDITFHYQAKDHDGALSEKRSVTFTVADDNDNPTVCQYTLFNQANECGIENCIGAMSPVGVITPTSHTAESPIYFYQEEAGVCWKSTGNIDAGSWEKEINGHIADININQAEEVVIQHIRFDEGGGVYENKQTLSVTSVTSSNEDVVRVENISLYIPDDGTYVPLNSVTNLKDGDDSADTIDYILKVTPNLGHDGLVHADNRGEALITLTLTDQKGSDEVDLSSEITVTFKVNVNPIDINHNGWTKVKALGPKIAGVAYCELEGVREVTEITSVEGVGGIALETLDPINPIVAFDILGGLEELAVAIDQSPYFIATHVTQADGSEKIIITNVNYGNANHDNEDDSACEDALAVCATITEGVSISNGDVSLTKADCEFNKGIWRDGEEVLESPYVCSFSEDQCNKGAKCLGAGAPENIMPDQFNAIYRDETTQSCYRARAQYNLSKLTLKSRLEGAIVLNITTDGVKGHEEVTVGTQYGLSDGVECDVTKKEFFRSQAFATHVVHLKIHKDSDDDDLYESLVGDGDMDCEDGDASCLLEVSLNASGETQQVNGGLHLFAPFEFYYGRIDDVLVLTKEANQKINFIDNNILLVDPAPEDANYKRHEDNLTVFQRVVAENNELRVNMNHRGTLACDLTRSINEEDDDLSDLIIKGKGSPQFVAVNLNLNNPHAKVKSGAATSMIHVPSAHVWEGLFTYCNVTQSKKATSCHKDMFLGASCIGYFSPNKPIDDTETTDVAFKDIRLGGAENQVMAKTFNEFFFDQKNNICYRSDVVDPVANNIRFSPYVATGTTTLGWENFGVSTNDVITGYNIYRKLGMVNGDDDFDSDDDGSLNFPVSFEFDRDQPINIYPIASSATEWTDNAQTSRHPPVPGTVYFYEVRPIIKNVPSRSPETFSVIRILSPPKNMALVHRWMANKKMCQVMHANERTDQERPSDYRIKRDDHFSCRYDSIGNVDSEYDIGQDYLVMQVEAGCPFSKNGCTGTLYDDGSCLGDISPEGVITAKKVGMVYYDRTSGTCYRAGPVDGTGWIEFKDVEDYEFAHSLMNYHLPPLVNITKKWGSDFCGVARFDVNTNTLGIVNASRAVQNLDDKSSGKGDFFPNALESNFEAMSLPSRQLQIAYSQWDTNFNDSEINTLETGLSLNSSSKCNSNDASGLEDGFTDTEYPAAGFAFSLPGTDDSQIRSLRTGSDYTKSCQTMFGLQDVIGNVSEFTSAEIAHKVTDFELNEDPSYKLDGAIGPCADDDGNGTCWEGGDGDLFSWVIDSEPNEASWMNLALGLPIVNDHTDKVYNFEIGPTNGITSEQLHDDQWIFNTDFHINFASEMDSSLISGGSYKNKSGAGTWFFELIDVDDGLRKDIGFRCAMPIIEKNYLESYEGVGVTNH